MIVGVKVHDNTKVRPYNKYRDIPRKHNRRGDGLYEQRFLRSICRNLGADRN